MRQDSVTVVKTNEHENRRINEEISDKNHKKLPFPDKHNIVPNNINHVLAFIQRKNKSEKLIGKIISREDK